MGILPVRATREAPGPRREEKLWSDWGVVQFWGSGGGYLGPASAIECQTSLDKARPSTWQGASSPSICYLPLLTVPLLLPRLSDPCPQHTLLSLRLFSSLDAIGQPMCLTSLRYQPPQTVGGPPSVPLEHLLHSAPFQGHCLGVVCSPTDSSAPGGQWLWLIDLCTWPRVHC